MIGGSHGLGKSRGIHPPNLADCAVLDDKAPLAHWAWHPFLLWQPSNEEVVAESLKEGLGEGLGEEMQGGLDDRVFRGFIGKDVQERGAWNLERRNENGLF